MLLTTQTSSIASFLSQPWHWAFSGTMIALSMFILLWFGKTFGVSSTMRTICSIGGAGKRWKFFHFDWKSQVWNLIFVFGGLLGGFIAAQWMQSPEPVQISEATIAHLQQNLNISTPQTIAEGTGYSPFTLEMLGTWQGWMLMVGGGFLVGFGARYAGGCTSGHAISGLSNLQIPSLIAVIGFFIGGLFMTHILLPLLL